MNVWSTNGSYTPSQSGITEGEDWFRYDHPICFAVTTGNSHALSQCVVIPIFNPTNKVYTPDLVHAVLSIAIRIGLGTHSVLAKC